jgi:hypothetical protein
LVARLLAATLVLVGIWGVAAGWSVRETRSARIQAERFLAEVVKLQVGTSRVEQVAPLVTKYHEDWKLADAPLVLPPSVLHSLLSSLRMSPKATSKIPGASCRVDFLFDNRWQHWLCFSPLTRFGATVSVRDNVVDHISVGLQTFQEGGPVVAIREYREGQRASAFSSRVGPSLALVSLTPGATPAQRTAAYSINIGCLTKLRGCRDTREMAPAIPQGIE